jgi:hypothetical protein
MQSLLSTIFKSETHRPSGVKEWQQPETYPFPIPPAFFRPLPDDEQDTSYFALSVKIVSFSCDIMLLLYKKAR